MCGSVAKRAVAYFARESPRQIIENERKKVWNILPFGLRLRYRTWKHARTHPKEALADPLKLLWVDPFDINDGTRFNRTRNVGEIIDGDWDLVQEDLTESQVYRGLRSRFVDGESWENTEYWEQAREKMENEGQVYGYNSFQDFQNHRLPFLENLYQSIVEEGYRTQGELDPSDRDEKRHRRYPKRYRVTHEVGVNIGRDGKLLLNSGIHRLSIARIAELDEIPVLVIVRHNEWQKKRDKQLHLDDPIESDHPDLQDLT